jgi:hypothetical protein
MAHHPPQHLVNGYFKTGHYLYLAKVQTGRKIRRNVMEILLPLLWRIILPLMSQKTIIKIKVIILTVKIIIITIIKIEIRIVTVTIIIILIMGIT